MIDLKALLALVDEPRTLPAQFVLAARGRPAAEVAVAAHAVARRLAPDARFEAGDESIRGLRAAARDDDPGTADAFWRLHRALHRQQIEDAAAPLGLHLADHRVAPLPDALATLVGAGAPGWLCHSRPVGLALQPGGPPIAASIEPKAWDMDPHSPDPDRDAEEQAGDLCAGLDGCMPSGDGHSAAAPWVVRPAPAGFAHLSLRIPGLTRLFIVTAR